MINKTCALTSPGFSRQIDLYLSSKRQQGILAFRKLAHYLETRMFLFNYDNCLLTF